MSHSFPSFHCTGMNQRHLTPMLLSLMLAGCGNLVTQGEVLSQLAVDDAGVPCTPKTDEKNWPVKVMFVIENSGRMCVIDPPGTTGSQGFCESLPIPRTATAPGRFEAMRRFVEANESRPNVSVALVAFSNITRKWGFTPTNTVQAKSMAQLGLELETELGPASDLQGGLEAAEQMMRDDVLATPESLRARTRYVVIVLSSGVPFPRCAANDALPTYASASAPDLIWADSSSVCNVADAAFLPAGFVAGGNWNQSSQLLDAVRRINDLDAQYGLGDVRVHSRMVFNQANLNACGAVCQDLFQLSFSDAHTVGTWTMSQLVKAGTWADPADPQGIDLSNVDTSAFTSFCPAP